MAFRLITAGTGAAITLAEAKAHCRVDTTAEDALLEGLISAATTYVEQYTSLALSEQTWELVTGQWKSEYLLKAPVRSVTSIKYVDEDGAEQTVSSSLYTLDDTTNRVLMLEDFTEPALRGEDSDITIRFVTGLVTVPQPIKLAILLLIALWYDNRAAASDRAMMPMPHAVDALLANYRIFAC